MRMFPKHPGPLSNHPETSYLCRGGPYRPLHDAGAVFGRCVVVSRGGALVSGAHAYAQYGDPGPVCDRAWNPSFETLMVSGYRGYAEGTVSGLKP